LDFSLYKFDTTFYNTLDNHHIYECGGSAVFRLIDVNNEELFLTLWNCHNGYYAHGFEMCDGETKLFGEHL